MDSLGGMMSDLYSGRGLTRIASNRLHLDEDGSFNYDHGNDWAGGEYKIVGNTLILNYTTRSRISRFRFEDKPRSDWDDEYQTYPYMIEGIFFKTITSTFTIEQGEYTFEDPYSAAKTAVYSYRITFDKDIWYGDSVGSVWYSGRCSN